MMGLFTSDLDSENNPRPYPSPFQAVDTEGNRPLSRRRDRCDRVIQNESRDPFGGNMYYVTMQIRSLRANFEIRNVICIVT